MIPRNRSPLTRDSWNLLRGFLYRCGPFVDPVGDRISHRFRKFPADWTMVGVSGAALVLGIRSSSGIARSEGEVSTGGAILPLPPRPTGVHASRSRVAVGEPLPGLQALTCGSLTNREVELPIRKKRPRKPRVCTYRHSPRLIGVWRSGLQGEPGRALDVGEQKRDSTEP